MEREAARVRAEEAARRLQLGRWRDYHCGGVEIRYRTDRAGVSREDELVPTGPIQQVPEEQAGALNDYVARRRRWQEIWTVTVDGEMRTCTFLGPAARRRMVYPTKSTSHEVRIPRREWKSQDRAIAQLNENLRRDGRRWLWGRFVVTSRPASGEAEDYETSFAKDWVDLWLSHPGHLDFVVVGGNPWGSNLVEAGARDLMTWGEL